MEITDEHDEVAGLEVHWRQAGDAPILYLHGVPTALVDWIPFLERTGGVAPDLPGSGARASRATSTTRSGYDRFLEAFTDTGLERSRWSCTTGAASGLVFAQRFPERIERLVLFTTLPLLPGYRWHRVARAWRTPVIGELMMGFTTRRAFRRDAAARDRRPRLGRLRPGHPAGDAQALPPSADPEALAATASGSASCAARR